MGFLIVLLSFVFFVGPLVTLIGMRAGYAFNSWQLCFFRAIGVVMLIHLFWIPYTSAVHLMAAILFYSVFDFVFRKIFPLSLKPPPQ